MSLGSHISGERLADIHTVDRVRESQLRGSGGVSPRFPFIPMRYVVDGVRLRVELVAEVLGEFKGSRDGPNLPDSRASKRRRVCCSSDGPILGPRFEEEFACGLA
jgi:hypothetical protein